MFLGMFLMILIAGLIFWWMTLNSDRAERILLGVYGKNDQPKIKEGETKDAPVEEAEKEKTLQP